MDRPPVPDGYTPWESVAAIDGFLPASTPLTPAERHAAAAFFAAISRDVSNGFEHRTFDDRGRLIVRHRALPAGEGVLTRSAEGVYHGIRERLFQLRLDPAPPAFVPPAAPAVTPAAGGATRRRGVRVALSRMFGAPPPPPPPSLPDLPPDPEYCEERSPAFAPAFRALQAWVTDRWADGTLSPALLRWQAESEAAEAARTARLSRRLEALPDEVRRDIADRIADAVLAHLPRWYLALADESASVEGVRMSVFGVFTRLGSELVDELAKRAGQAQRPGA